MAGVVSSNDYQNVAGLIETLELPRQQQEVQKYQSNPDYIVNIDGTTAHIYMTTERARRLMLL